MEKYIVGCDDWDLLFQFILNQFLRGAGMKKEAYVCMMQRIKEHPNLVMLICKGNRFLTCVVYVIYFIFMFCLLISRNDNCLRILCTTTISFLSVSLFRKVFNSPRPYERFGEPSVIKKEKKGSSFPSRHVFSAFVIAVCFCHVNIWLGIFLLLVAVGIAVFRVIGGVHFPNDVVAGAVMGIVCAVIGMRFF